MGYRTDSTPVTHMDIMPTVLSAAGVPVPDNVEGVDFMGPLYGKKVENRDFIHGEHTCGNLIGVQFVTNGKYKYCFDTIYGREQLFNLENDPQELNNLVSTKGYEHILELWKQRLIGILTNRPQDGLVENGELVRKAEIPPIRKELLKGISKSDIHPNAQRGIRDFFGEDFFNNK